MAVASFASYVATALLVNSVSVTTPAKKDYVPLLESGGLNPSLLIIWGLSRPYVEPPLCLTHGVDGHLSDWKRRQSALKTGWFGCPGVKTGSVVDPQNSTYGDT